MGSIKERGVAKEIHIDRQTTLGVDQPAVFFHLPITLGTVINRGPEGDHQFNAHLF